MLGDPRHLKGKFVAFIDGLCSSHDVLGLCLQEYNMEQIGLGENGFCKCKVSIFISQREELGNLYIIKGCCKFTYFTVRNLFVLGFKR